MPLRCDSTALALILTLHTCLTSSHWQLHCTPERAPFLLRHSHKGPRGLGREHIVLGVPLPLPSWRVYSAQAPGVSPGAELQLLPLTSGSGRYSLWTACLSPLTSPQAATGVWCFFHPPNELLGLESLSEWSTPGGSRTRTQPPGVCALRVLPLLKGTAQWSACGW